MLNTLFGVSPKHLALFRQAAKREEEENRARELAAWKALKWHQKLEVHTSRIVEFVSSGKVLAGLFVPFIMAVFFWGKMLDGFYEAFNEAERIADRIVNK